ncbi:uncharacterized protein ATNIH1004_005241 [Aspergillus tanneri]|uniref:Amine oxidase domain-containing protein n=1 Tax=Aspergillus tanneri TaxID=1220188 RepID=A0A5M9MVI0_9EURO|nr:uncharacterized protein ATNIH1004_005241 [Aspergillus tanneri]KAA8649340.1 hypothetical protein ATNIH1004_005241 [Aspergillus tanneri]
MSSSESRQRSVAIIGSGPAGLCAAYLLGRSGYEVTVFEKSSYLTLAGHSYRVTKDKPGIPQHVSTWKSTDAAANSHSSMTIDIPLRVFSGRYYTNWWRLLNHLGVETQVHLFHYMFTISGIHYARFYSNFHRVLPCLANGLWMNLYLLFWYAWFTAACFMVRPRTNVGRSGLVETFDQYIQRILLPKRFMDWFILPLFSAVATCSHDDLRRIPAAYIVNYRKGTCGFHHRTVRSMEEVERRLSEGVAVKLGHTVCSVESKDNGCVQVEYCPPGHSRDNATRTNFGHVILAISAAEATRIHRASAKVTAQLATRKVSVKVHRPAEGGVIYKKSWDKGSSEGFLLHTEEIGVDELLSHSTHFHPSGMVVTVSPVAGDDTKHGKVVPLSVDHEVILMRPLVTAESHALLHKVFAGRTDKGPKTWKNGDGNVYLASGYCSTGLPLLESCVRSALEAAVKIGADVPFEISRPTPF